MKRSSESDLSNMVSYLTMIIGILVLLAILFVMARIQSGVVGLILAGIVGAILVFWIKEIRGIIIKEFRSPSPAKRTWTYDLITERDAIALIAEVPGPQKEVKISLDGEVLEIRGGNSFFKTVNLPESTEILASSYVNGVLHVKMRKSRSKKQDVGGNTETAS